ncbi:hypothetical protein HY620_02250 [Candidatus Uhrbacteria bacterium]|nr:hypothetical protein [Candidatus Uhrbacteria bacterium]
MFDLIEEALLTEKQETKALSPGVSQAAVPLQNEPVVFAMPEKFREKPQRTSKAPLIIGLGIIALLLVGSTVAVLIVLSKPDPEKSSVVEIKKEEQAQEQEQKKEEQPVQTEPDQTQSIQVPAASTLPDEPEQKTEVQQEAPQQQTDTTESTTPLQQDAQGAPGTDVDGDALTDTEERLYGTDVQKPDSDGDGFSDNDEILRLYDPLHPQGARLDTSGLVNTYTNQTFKYSLYYPSSWIAKPVNAAEKEVVLSTASGEFFSITAEDNPDHLSALEWYTKVVSPQENNAQVQTSTSDTWTAVKSLDALTVYITRNTARDRDGGIVIVLKYNINTKRSLEFASTFQMMLQSFIFTDLSFTRK